MEKMGKTARFCGLVIIGIGWALPTQTARADYVIEVVDSITGGKKVTAEPGDKVLLDVLLTSDATPGDLTQLVQFNVNFSQGGLIFQGYDYDPDGSPVRYPTGAGDDLSVPGLGLLPLDIVAGAPFPVSAAIDIFFNNAPLDDPATGQQFTFGPGVIVSLSLLIPNDFLDPSGDPVKVSIDAEGVLFRRGFQTIASSPGETFQLNVVPEPTTLLLLAAGGLVGVLRRRRR